MQQTMIRLLTILITLNLLPATIAAEESQDSTRVFTEEHPLVYEDAWDLWPYAFLNEVGDPVGYNIDLLKIIMRRLDIPYIIKLKPTSEALKDLKAGHADLMCGMAAEFHDDYAKYGKSIIQLFTHSIVHQKGVLPKVKTVNDLSSHVVLVHAGAFSHHLMKDKGWEANSVPYNDMQDAVQKAHSDPKSQVLWNTMSLKYLIQKFKYDNLELSPVDMPNGEYKFMSNNQELLNKIDSIYIILNSEGQFQAIQNKWFYPERVESGIPTWIWHVATGLSLLIIALLTYYGFYRMREKKMTRDIKKSNNQLALILKTSKVKIWIYDVSGRTITSLDNDGQPESNMPSTEYFKQAIPHDIDRLKDAIASIVKGKENKVTLDIFAKDNSEETEFRNYTVEISVLHRDRNGKPTDLIGTRSDITEGRKKQQKVKNMMLRYQSIFNSTMIDMIAYDENGYINDLNEKSLLALNRSKEEIKAAHISISDVLGWEVDLDTLDTLYLTQIFKSPDDERVLNKILKYQELYYELKIEPVRDENGKLLAIYGTGRNVTENAKAYSSLKRNMELLRDANIEMRRYIKNIDYVLHNGSIKIATYSPSLHILNIYSEIGHVQYRLTQTRTIQLTDEAYKDKALRLLNNMDNLSAASINTAIKTVIRQPGGKRLFLQVSFIPSFDKEGNVTGYFGMCRDVTDIKATEADLARETIKAQEVETVKNAFLHNMSYEIRTPLNSVVGFAELFEMEHSPEDEKIFTKEIKESSSMLLNLINDILFLSRLDAKMIEFKYKPTDFATIFDARCQAAAFHCQKPGVNYIYENPYNSLIVDIDEQNLGIVIDQIVRRAVEDTTSGQVRCRCDYTGDHLIIGIQDTGKGISEENLKHIFDRFTQTDNNSTGLGMSICQELVNQMKGKITIKSTVGEGTIVWVSIPCSCSKIDRK